ncbi:myrcene synthase, chloroplastic-like [Nymphaea colorata]|nr:myrcene synthase, chloroplastic-like [Nymphaea colorata]XP_031499348.1 myrcene synthase, chloroplastic-like [Nymphaea colorata]XP_031499349.1 myrcene synthase, chloroplastic-like [Nymphaea colorata]XP_031499350.1 myrcene synthase, chloroplastic-like [Nymphaea colorata]
MSQPVQRRSGNYPPSRWTDDLIQSLKSTHEDDHGSENIEEIKQNVRQVLEGRDEPVAQMELVDDLQRLGVSYHFEKEIKLVMDCIFEDRKECEDLYFVALRFRLLRQHGYHASPDVFQVFVDERGRFRNVLAEDLKALLNLYEASHLRFEGEHILKEAMDFTTHHLRESTTKSNNSDCTLAIQIAHALEIPLSRRMLRSEARNYIDLYERMPGHHSCLLKLAKLDFNNVQSLYQAEVKEMSRWWRELQLATNLKFARDRLMDNYLWAVGVIFNPPFSVCRKGLTKVACLITAIDDVYDVYGTLDELELFSEVVEKWEIGYIDKLPQYMRLCFLALYNTTNQFAYDFMRDKGRNILGYLTRAWAELCKAYLVEAKWFYNGYTPTVEEYLDNAWVSMSGPVFLIHAYFFMQHAIKEDATMDIDHYINLIKKSSITVRLQNDLGTSKDEIERGDVPKCIQCYMKEKSVSEEAARQYVDGLLGNAWKELHKECTEATSNGTSHPLVHCALNLARMAQFMYQHGDAYGFAERDYPVEPILKLMVESV